MKSIKKITSTALTVVLLGASTIPVHAEAAPNEKQEVIYVMTDDSGKVNDIEVVNIFSGGEITDYGDYSSVKVLNTTDKINQNGDKINISSDSDKIYYQGTMKQKKIPWDISIRYFLDGKEYSGSEIAGKSGALEIRFSISKNMNLEDSFYEDYALQASFTMDSEKCTDIVAEGATLANVGSDKQISYTILPGKGIDTVITANVTDFEMSAVSVNGIKLDLNVDIDDAELKSKVNDLIEAVNQLDNGALKLNDGAEELLNGLNRLNKQSASLVNGSSEFKKALKNNLNAGASALQANLGYTQYKALMKKNGIDIDGLKSGNANAVNAIKNCEALLDEISQIPGYENIAAKYKPSLSQTAALLNANNATLGGMESYLNGISGELPALTNGINQLVDNYQKLDSGIVAYTDGTAKLYNGALALYDGTGDMADGTGKFRSETSGMNEKIEEEIDNILDTIGGSMEHPVSFVSSQNSNVDSVQFVIKTTAIEKTEEKVIETVEPEHLNFGQKLLKLFGIN